MRIIALFLAILCSTLVCAQKENTELWYKAPAKKWTEALPVGNGRLGGMVYGDYQKETIQLNEESVWAGSKIDNSNPGAPGHLKEIQQVLFSGDYKKALDLSNKYLVGTPSQVRSYQPLGNLFIQYHWKTAPTTYKRSLDLHTGIARTAYTIDGNKIVQEVFSSAPQNAIIVSISAEKEFNADVLLTRQFDSTYEVKDKKKKVVAGLSLSEDVYKNENGLYYYTGQIIDLALPNKGPAGKHLRYAAAMKIIAVNGKMVNAVSDTATSCSLHAVKSILILLTGATNYNIDKLDTDSLINPLSICKEILSKASGHTYIALKQIQEQDHRVMFDRVQFSLGKDTLAALATDERLERMKKGNTDNGLIALYYQYGRYLLMGSSRKPGRLPANLQGIWNDLYDAAWNSDFHTNINLQMNYWPAETANLTETSLVLSNFVKKLTVPGSVTAREMYGARGWTMHHLTDPYGRTGVSDGVWGITSTDGAWMTFPLYDHFEFTSDTNFLRETAYPVMKGAVEFILDFLIRSPDGYMVTNPSHSPENSFYVPGTDKKEKTQMTYAPTSDTHIINELFNNFSHAAAILHKDPGMVVKVKAMQKQLPPLKVTDKGTIQEWIQDFEEVDPGHRHMSHLLGVYPLNLITPHDTVFFEAAKKTLERRIANGGGHQGWSKAWMVSLYARLLDAEKAGDNLNDLLRKSTLDNLFDTHPPFQIDGNFGGTAAIAEMLLQSQNGEIQLLPALPAAWQEGSIHGIHARGACSLDIDWQNGKLTRVLMHSLKGGIYTIYYENKIRKLDCKPGESIVLDKNLNILSKA